MTRITTKFNAATTADEVIAGVDLSGKRAIVTGGASGIGVETARSLARAGAEVTIAVRNLEAGAKVAKDITESTGNPAVHVAPLDLLDLDSVNAFAASWDGPLDLLINNAGVMAIAELRRTSNGWEEQFATNHLGHFALSLGLHDALASAGKARIVSLSSSGHMASPVVFDDIHFERRVYDPWAAYGQSKTANALFAVEATRRWSGDGIFANSVMPGGIQTNLGRHASQEQIEQWKTLPGLKTPQQGASTTLVAAVAPEFEGVGGRYLEDANEAKIIANDAEPGALTVGAGVRVWALDPATAAQLWEVSLAMLAEAQTH
ncbi:MAG TPA: SDR family NAD(P)-dependent oxidoreductase [Arthrobacter sp.]|nr:SDR family NAD(P)-dependent oxidoreductase [Arthrobacter sp.]